MASRSYGAVQMSGNSAEQMRSLLRQMADFIALYETIEEKLVAREIALEGKLIAGEKLLAEQLAKIKESFVSFQAIMTDAGAARWRIAAENALKEGGQHIRELQETSVQINQALKQGCDAFEKAATDTIAGIAEAGNSFQALGFKEAVAKGCEQVKETSSIGIKRLSKFLKSFHLKSIVLSLTLTMFAVFLTGLYINNEWPWEIHMQASKERHAGQTLLAAWPHLTPAEQQDILNASKRDNGGKT